MAILLAKSVDFDDVGTISIFSRTRKGWLATKLISAIIILRRPFIAQRLRDLNSGEITLVIPERFGEKSYSLFSP